MKIAIMTDTNSGITQDEAKKEGIFLLPMPIDIDDKCFLEGIDLQADQLYEALENDCRISTSQPSPGSIMDLWDSILAQGYDEIIHIPMTSGLSGSCQSATMLAEEYDSKVYVVDNHRISATQRISVLEAKKMADIGCSAQEIKDYLEETAFSSSIYLTVESLKYLQKGGRLSSSAAVLGTLLNIKPILSLQGHQIDAYAKVRGMKKCEKKMIDAIREDISSRFADIPQDRLQVDTAGTLRTPEEIEHWRTTVQEAFPDTYVNYSPLPCSIASHVGPGCIGIGVSLLR